MIANDRDLSGVTMRSSTLPTISPFSLYTLRPRICRLTLHPRATSSSSLTSTPTVVDPAIWALTGVAKTVAKAAVVRLTNPARTEIFMEDSRFEGGITIKNISESRLAVGTRPGIVSRNADPPCHTTSRLFASRHLCRRWAGGALRGAGPRHGWRTPGGRYSVCSEPIGNANACEDRIDLHRAEFVSVVLQVGFDLQV